MVIETTPTFPVLTPQSPLLTVSRQAEDPEEVLRRAGAGAHAAVVLGSAGGPPAGAEAAGEGGLGGQAPGGTPGDLPQCGVLISSSLSGGTAMQRFSEAAEAAPGRCWLLLEWLSMEFPLPCPSGDGQALGKEALHARLQDRQSFFDSGLCCAYTHWLEDGRGRMVLYDTADTLTQKVHLARQAGFQGVVLKSA